MLVSVFTSPSEMDDYRENRKTRFGITSELSALDFTAEQK